LSKFIWVTNGGNRTSLATCFIILWPTWLLLYFFVVALHHCEFFPKKKIESTEPSTCCPHAAPRVEVTMRTASLPTFLMFHFGHPWPLNTLEKFWFSGLLPFSLDCHTCAPLGTLIGTFQTLKPSRNETFLRMSWQ
jgi:hypothetical protein